MQLRFPHGAPIPVGTEAWLENGESRFTPSRTWHKEVRCFIEQSASSVVSCTEGFSGDPFIERRLILRGLKNATVHFYPENDRKVLMTTSDATWSSHGIIPYVEEDAGKRLVANEVTGQLVISW